MSKERERTEEGQGDGGGADGGGEESWADNPPSSACRPSTASQQKSRVSTGQPGSSERTDVYGEDACSVCPAWGNACVRAQWLSRIRPFGDPVDGSPTRLLSTGFSRQGHDSAAIPLLQGNLPDPGSEPASFHFCTGDRFFTALWNS